jgi:fructokinase
MLSAYVKEVILLSRIGAIEAGGTKMVLAVGNERGTLEEYRKIPTLNPIACVHTIVEWFSSRNIDALGVGAFGPTCVNPNDPRFGRILETPKTAWRYFNFYGALADGLHVPIGYDTDVNGACLGESTFGAAKDLNHVVYVTVGTGIGAGVMINGQLLHGMLHAEAGHIKVAKLQKDFGESVCPYHKSCLEGMASGPSIEHRWGKKPIELTDQLKVWDIESSYLAEGLATYILCYSPQRIILGGGVMHQKQLFPLIRRKTLEELGGYVLTPELADIDSYIVPAGCGGNQGILGALELGCRALV